MTTTSTPTAVLVHVAFADAVAGFITEALTAT